VLAGIWFRYGSVGSWHVVMLPRIHPRDGEHRAQWPAREQHQQMPESLRERLRAFMNLTNDFGVGFDGQ
jgi:hypothetical protein